ncbi:ATP-binding protein [Anaerocolumna sp. AGMB13025]|uniref:sensor histidine kinase n=1 Tax=Anaerocolumna sp. AGMB13025 TaxID=3039116 RepID=UPI00241E9ABD|nr:ATP-binding protein [Anaerocolumna sp. AGMB13025]WFR57537.1 ATP-binding protein [Anaerocolumna sp. AGMB13025]
MKNKFWKFTLIILLYAILSLFLGSLATLVLAYGYYKLFDNALVRLEVRWLVSVAEGLFSPGWCLVYMAVTLFIAVILMWLFTRRTTKRMSGISSAVWQMREGSFRVLLPNDYKDSLGQIEQGINALAAQVQDSQGERKEAEQAKNDFIINIAHDLRTPLTSIIGYLSFISERQLDSELSAKYAKIALKKSEQLETLVESFFDVANFTMNTITLNKKEINLIKFLHQKQDELYPQLNEANMEIRLYLDKSVSTIQADGDLIARVFDNLIGNAIRYAKEGKYIDIEAKADNKKIYISFTTHANPIPASELENIFDKLYRLEKSRAKGTGGSGLGLPISRSIIQLHDGTLTARQTFDGTAFDICLPK